MATDQLINKTQGDAIIAGLAAIKNAINDQPVPTQVEDVVSDAFDVGVSYVPGDYCIYENKLYKCDVAHHGAWDGNDFTLTNVGAELDTLNNALTADTGWVQPSNNRRFYYRVLFNKIVFIKVDYQNQTVPSGSLGITMPSAYRPGVRVNFADGSATGGSLQIETNGAVSLNGIGASQLYFKLDASYLIYP